MNVDAMPINETRTWLFSKGEQLVLRMQYRGDVFITHFEAKHTFGMGVVSHMDRHYTGIDGLNRLLKYCNVIQKGDDDTQLYIDVDTW